jgi:heme/copper-type cytochrome/quinol oxidase subunit 2
MPGIPVAVFPQQNVIEVQCRKSQYTPDVIRVKKGEAVTLLISSVDVTHGFAIDEFGIAEEVVPGRPAKVAFTPDKTGEFFYYCVVRCGKKHKQMRGKLIVE